MIHRLLVSLLVVTSLLSGVAVADVEGTPRLDVALPQYLVSVGEETTLRFTVANNADLDTASMTNPALNARVTTARSVSLDVRAGSAPVTIETTRQSLGSLPDGGVATVSVDIAVDDDARPGIYQLPVVVRYAFDETIADDGTVDTRSRTKRTSVTLKIEDHARFRVLDTTTDLQPASTGVVTVTMKNVGSKPAADAQVTLASTAASLTFDGAAAGSRYVGTWGPGELRTISYIVTASDTVRPQPYTFEVTTTFTDTSGDTVSTGANAVGVTPLSRVPITVDGARSSLSVGDRGVVTGMLVNDGSETLHDAVVHIDTTSPAIAFTERAYPIGVLEAGAQVEFTFTADVSPTATAGPRLFDVAVTYETADGSVRTSDTVRLAATVAPERAYVLVTPVNATFDVDSDNRLTVRVTNVGNETLTDLNARVLPQAPLTSDAPESFVPRLKPGESALVHFAVTVSEDAVANTHAVALNVTAETAAGTTMSRTHPVAVSVVEPARENSDLAVLGVGTLAVLLVLVGGWWWLRR